MTGATSGCRTSLALATCAAYPDLDIDDQFLLEPLRELGVDPIVAVWNDADVDWQQFDLVVIRSTWDYTQHHQGFLQWARGLESVSALLNPLPVIAWSSEKTYLRDLQRAGVPIVPTTFVAPGQPWTFPMSEFVVKPAISAGSRNTFRMSSSNTAAGDEAITSLHAQGRIAMIQPYFHSIDVQAETAMIFFEGQFSHAVSKAALLPLDAPSQVFERGLFLREKIALREARPDQLAVAKAALDRAPEDWLYARVDLIDDRLGNPVVLELEMVEPSLFLGFHAGDSDDPAVTLAKHIARRLSAVR